LREEVKNFEELEGRLKELKELIGLNDETLENELKEAIDDLEGKILAYEKQILLQGKYDRTDALLEIFAGAGGLDAQDFATMLLRMYQRYCERRGWKTMILHHAFGEPGGPEGRVGTKEASLEIKGAYAYGLLKGERGVHRLVRLSPFSAKQLRHTSFAKVDVLPLLAEKETSEIKIKPEDLRIETFRASGPGGQYVNKRETAVRLTHLPSNITVACQTERLQGLNRKKAMQMLHAKLAEAREKKIKEEMVKIKGKPVEAEWGNQIRSYVLHPYKMVKDLRTDVETSDTEGVLDGELDEFIEAELKFKS
jgi:peptide chain release factor 2